MAGLRPRDLFATLLKNVFGAKVKMVTGYQGGNDVNLAMERREVDGRCGWSACSTAAHGRTGSATRRST